MTTTHTPTPWTRKFGQNVYAGESHTQAGRLLFVAEPTNGSSKELAEAWANAEFVVRACNAHDDLVNALQVAEGCLVAALGDLGQAYLDSEVCNTIRAAISKAKGL